MSGENPRAPVVMGNAMILDEWHDLRICGRNPFRRMSERVKSASRSDENDDDDNYRRANQNQCAEKQDFGRSVKVRLSGRDRTLFYLPSAIFGRSRPLAYFSR